MPALEPERDQVGEVRAVPPAVRPAGPTGALIRSMRSCVENGKPTLLGSSPGRLLAVPGKPAGRLQAAGSAAASWRSSRAGAIDSGVTPMSSPGASPGSLSRCGLRIA